MTIGPRGGEPLDYQARPDEILQRYTADSVVSRAMLRARPEIEGAIRRTQMRL